MAEKWNLDGLSAPIPLPSSSSFSSHSSSTSFFTFPSQVNPFLPLIQDPSFPTSYVPLFISNYPSEKKLVLDYLVLGFLLARPEQANLFFDILLNTLLAPRKGFGQKQKKYSKKFFPFATVIQLFAELDAAHRPAPKPNLNVNYKAPSGNPQLPSSTSSSGASPTKVSSDSKSSINALNPVSYLSKVGNEFQTNTLATSCMFLLDSLTVLAFDKKNYKEFAFLFLYDCLQASPPFLQKNYFNKLFDQWITSNDITFSKLASIIAPEGPSKKKLQEKYTLTLVSIPILLSQINSDVELDLFHDYISKYFQLPPGESIQSNLEILKKWISSKLLVKNMYKLFSLLNSNLTEKSTKILKKCFIDHFFENLLSCLYSEGQNQVPNEQVVTWFKCLISDPILVQKILLNVDLNLEFGEGMKKLLIILSRSQESTQILFASTWKDQWKNLSHVSWLWMKALLCSYSLSSKTIQILIEDLLIDCLEFQFKREIELKDSQFEELVSQLLHFFFIEGSSLQVPFPKCINFFSQPPTVIGVEENFMLNLVQSKLEQVFLILYRTTNYLKFLDLQTLKESSNKTKQSEFGEDKLSYPFTDSFQSENDPMEDQLNQDPLSFPQQQQQQQQQKKENQSNSLDEKEDLAPPPKKKMKILDQNYHIIEFALTLIDQIFDDKDQNENHQTNNFKNQHQAKFFISKLFSRSQICSSVLVLFFSSPNPQLIFKTLSLLYNFVQFVPPFVTLVDNRNHSNQLTEIEISQLWNHQTIDKTLTLLFHDNVLISDRAHRLLLHLVLVPQFQTIIFDRTVQHILFYSSQPDPIFTFNSPCWKHYFILHSLIESKSNLLTDVFKFIQNNLFLSLSNEETTYPNPHLIYLITKIIDTHQHRQDQPSTFFTEIQILVTSSLLGLNQTFSFQNQISNSNFDHKITSTPTPQDSFVNTSSSLENNLLPSRKRILLQQIQLRQFELIFSLAKTQQFLHLIIENLDFVSQGLSSHSSSIKQTCSNIFSILLSSPFQKNHPELFQIAQKHSPLIRTIII